MTQFQENAWTEKRPEGRTEGQKAERPDRHYFIGPLRLPQRVQKQAV